MDTDNQQWSVGVHSSAPFPTDAMSVLATRYNHLYRLQPTNDFLQGGIMARTRQQELRRRRKRRKESLRAAKKAATKK
jgi:hypothetical protein